ncbi:MAG TPA: hypothetical protein VEO54_10010 [Thermoanaerobaculia bacterium]|nr:hypothetical protein [Thermoanaerobaculia bacterium]
MTDEERAHVIVTARLLRAAASLSGLAVGLTIVAAFQVAIAAIVLGVAAIYFCFRVSLDAKLFDDVAAGRIATDALDRALGRAEARPTSSAPRAMRMLNAGRASAGPDAPRDWIDRSRGAKRLIVQAAIAVIAQLAALVLSSVYG